LNTTLRFASLAAVAAALFVWALPAGAQQQQIETAQAAPASPAPSPSPSPSPTPSPKPFQYSGFADVGYQSAAFTMPNNVITGRVFDTLNQQPQFHNFNLQASYTGRIGGKIEASFGDDADVINSYPKSVLDPGTEVDITQAYLSYTAGPFTLIGGKFETLAGAEVIESPSDYNYSRSILFGFAVPFTHTGGRLTYAPTSAFSLIAGVNKGWDTTRDIKSAGDSSAATLEYGTAWNPSSKFSLTAQGYSGTVEEGSVYALAPTGPRPYRSLIDAVGTYHLTSAMTFVINGDYGRQTNTTLLSGTGAITGVGTATWTGVAGYFNDAFSPLFAGALRLEYFNDAGGSRTGLSQHWEEGTLTFSYTPNPNLIFRLEGRGDKSNRYYFINKNGFGFQTNDTVGVEAIVKYP
jgi:hypothetical protein